MGLLSRSCPLLLLLLLVLAALDVTTGATCTNTNPCVADCTACTQFDAVPDPTDCTRFYLCDANENIYDTPFNCDPGEVFDITTAACSDNATCTTCPPVCEFACTVGGSDFISSTSDCQIYYDCANYPLSPPLTCPDSAPFFDGLSCQSDQARCCRCLPSLCYTAPSLIADPLDCRNYYGCTVAGSAPTLKGSCDPGETFDFSIGGCSATAACNTVCKNVVDPVGCIDPFTCEAPGYFAKCPELCEKEYYYCPKATDEYPSVQSCSGDEVFHPDSHDCVSLDQCPYQTVVPLYA